MPETLALEVQEPHLSAKGREALAWLKKKLGEHRVTGPRRDPFSDDGDVEILLVRHDGKGVTCYGSCADVAVERAIEHVKWATKHPRRAAER